MDAQDTFPVPPAILLVGYRLRLNDKAEEFMPAYSAPSNYKDDVKIAEYVVKKQTDYVKLAERMPYTATFDEVYISDLASKGVNRWAWSADRGPTKNKPPICVSAAAWILKRHPTAWTNELTGSRQRPAVLVLGFNPRLFLKLLGLECSLPEHGRPLPLGMWYENVDHRDIANAIIPHEFGDDLKLGCVLRSRGIKPADGWTGPGIVPEEDVRITTELAQQLGMLRIETKNSAKVNL